MPRKSPVRRTPAVKTGPVTAKPVVAATPAVTTPAVVAAPVVEKAVIATVSPVAAARPFPAELVADLRNDSVEVAVEAAGKLAESKDARAVAPLIAVLANVDGFCHVVTRAAAAMALAKFDTNESRIALLAAAKDGMAEVSREACLSLGHLPAADSLATLVEIAENTSGFYLNVVRHAAVRSLGRLKAKQAKSVLEAIAANTNEDASLTAAAKEALAAM